MQNTLIHQPRGFFGDGMRRGALAFFLGCAAAATAAATADVEEIVRRNEPAAVVVVGEKPGGATVQGSGCFVDAAGKVLTSLHQVDGLDDIHIICADGTRHGASLLAVDRAHDLALLKTPAKPARWASLGDSASLKSGAAIVAIAAPRNLQFSAVTGIVSSPNRSYKGMRVLQSDLPAEPGSSGGPVFNADGALIGCIVGRLETEQWVTVINPIDNAYGLLAANGVAVPGRRISDIMLNESEIVPAPGISPLHRQAIQIYNRGVAANSEADKIQAYDAAVKLLPDFYEAWFNLAVASAAADQPTRAITAYRIAQKLRPEAVEVPHNLGRVFLSLGRREDAAETFARAVELAPDSPSAQNDLGEAYRRLGRLDEARQAFQAALQLHAAYAPARYNLALTCAAAGEKAEAARHLRAYLQADPAAPDAAEVEHWLKTLEEAP